MSYTFAVQVPTGKEIDFKVLLLNLLQRCGNPGIVAIHALETFTQTLGGKGLSLRRWRAKVPGYIFVTVERAEGLEMDAACWHIINKIPLMKRILNRYISQAEWEMFFGSIKDAQEPEIEISIPHTSKGTIKKETAKAKAPKAKFTLTELFQKAKQVLETAKTKAAPALTPLQSALAATKKYIRGNRTIYAVPLRLYKILLEQHNKGSSERMTVQNAVHELKVLLGAVIRWQT